MQILTINREERTADSGQRSGFSVQRSAFSVQTVRCALNAERSTLYAPRHPLGFTLLGVVIAIGILAAFGSSMTLMVAANQRTRSQVLYMDQGFGSVQAGFEFALRQILVSGSTASNFTRHLANGGVIAITRTGGLIKVTVTQGTATAAYQITDPAPPP